MVEHRDADYDEFRALCDVLQADIEHESTDSCVHHWMLESPIAGRILVSGQCRKCHASHSWPAFNIPTWGDRYSDNLANIDAWIASHKGGAE